MRNKNFKRLRPVFSGISKATFVIVLGKVIQFFLLLKLAMFLDSNQFATFVSALVLGQIFGLIIIPGGQQGLTALISMAVSKNDSTVFRGALWLSMLLIFCFILILAVLAILSKYIISFDVLYKNMSYFLVVLINVFSTFRMAFTRGFGFIFRGLFYIEVVAPFVLLALLHKAPPLFDIIPFAIAWSAMYLTFELISILVCKEPMVKLFLGSKGEFLFPMKNLKDLITIQLSNVFSVAILRLDVVLLTAISGPLISAPYILVNKFVQPISILARILSNSTAPMIAREFALGGGKETKRLTLVAFVFISTSILLLLCTMYFSFEYLRNYLDSKYDLSYEVLYYLAAAYMMLSLCAPFSQHLIMTKKASYLLVIHLIAFIAFYGLVILAGDTLSANSMAKFILMSTLFISLASFCAYTLVGRKTNSNNITSVDKKAK